jgi:hypothetical protein
MIVHAPDRDVVGTIDALGRWELDSFLFLGRRGCGVLTSVRGAFFRRLCLKRVDHILLLLAPARSFSLEDLPVDIEVFFLDEVWFLAVFDSGIWLSRSVAVGRMQESRKETLRTTDLLRGLERVTTQVDFAIDVSCSFCLNTVRLLNTVGGIVVIVVVAVWVGFFSFLLDYDGSRIGSSDFFVSVGFKEYVVDYIIENVVEDRVGLLRS